MNEILSKTANELELVELEVRAMKLPARWDVDSELVIFYSL